MFIIVSEVYDSLTEVKLNLYQNKKHDIGVFLYKRLNISTDKGHVCRNKTTKTRYTVTFIGFMLTNCYIIKQEPGGAPVLLYSLKKFIKGIYLLCFFLFLPHIL